MSRTPHGVTVHSTPGVVSALAMAALRDIDGGILDETPQLREQVREMARWLDAVAWSIERVVVEFGPDSLAALPMTLAELMERAA